VSLNEEHCRYPARLAAALASQLLCFQEAHDANYAFVGDRLADLGHRWWFSATGTRRVGSDTDFSDLAQGSRFSGLTGLKPQKTQIHFREPFQISLRQNEVSPRSAGDLISIPNDGLGRVPSKKTGNEFVVKAEME
jgi:hypothetical protein